MKHINIGGSGITASAIGIGCMRIGEKTPAQVAGLIEAALDAGIDLFDHADIYGGGKAEELFGGWLAQNPARRDKMVIQSKCGIRSDGYDLSKAHILGAVDGILRRLRTDYLDILLLHRPDTLMEPEEIAEAFGALAAAGKVRAFGVSNMNPAQMALLARYTGRHPVANQLQFSCAHTGLVDSGINANVPNPRGDARDESVLEYCRLEGITIQSWSTLQYGFFEGTFLGSPKYPELNAELDRLAAQKGCTAAAVAVAWVLRHPAKMQAIVGSTSTARVAEMAKAAEVELTREEWYGIYTAAGNALP